jgi:hypothetical protein
MHPELQTLVRAAAVLKKIEDALSVHGIVADEYEGGYLFASFCQRCGPEEGVHIALQFNVEMRDGKDGEDEFDGIKVGAILFFGKNSLFYVGYDSAKNKWGMFLDVVDDLVEVRPEALEFAKAFGVPAVTRDDEDPAVMSETRAFEVVAAMAARMRASSSVDVALRAERGAKMN